MGMNYFLIGGGRTPKGFIGRKCARSEQQDYNWRSFWHRPAKSTMRLPNTLTFVIANFLFVLALCVVPAFSQAGNRATERPHQRQWLTRFREELPLLGHRNWIAVVDSAYPLQTSPGLETVETSDDQLDVVQEVLDRVEKSGHVRAVVFTDEELKAVPESDAPGVDAYRAALGHLLEKSPAQSLPHEQIIAKLGEAGNTFHVLVLKTKMTIPYTSVFIRLDCGYWTDEQEKRLRQKMAGK
jgi:hypothetical protein